MGRREVREGSPRFAHMPPAHTSLECSHISKFLPHTFQSLHTLLKPSSHYRQVGFGGHDRFAQRDLPISSAASGAKPHTHDPDAPHFASGDAAPPHLPASPDAPLAPHFPPGVTAGSVESGRRSVGAGGTVPAQARSARPPMSIRGEATFGEGDGDASPRGEVGSVGGLAGVGGVGGWLSTSPHPGRQSPPTLRSEDATPGSVTGAGSVGGGVGTSVGGGRPAGVSAVRPWSGRSAKVAPSPPLPPPPSQ